MKTALTIAGSDSSGGAGIQQDLKVFSHFGIHGTSVVTSITAQNTRGVQSVHSLSEDIVSAQLDSVLSDLKPSAIKTGMLFSSGIISVIRKKIVNYGNLVVDPVMISTSGDMLLDEGATEELRKLISIARLSTPNIHEAEILSGIRIRGIEDMEAAAREIGNCVVKGGHLGYTDVLNWNDEIFHFPARSISRAKIHGSGCAFSAAIASCLANGMDIPDAVEHAKEFITSAIGRNFRAGSGLRFADTGGIKLSRTPNDGRGSKLLSSLEEAVNRFVSNEGSYRVMPEVGVNIAMALPGAKRPDRVAGITGRIVKDGKRAVPVGSIDFGGSSHIGRVVLTAMKYDADKRAAMNIKFSNRILKACRELGLSMVEFDRKMQPRDTKTMEWGISEAINNFGRVPDVVYDRGGIGKEAMIRIIGDNAKEVVETAIRIYGRISP